MSQQQQRRKPLLTVVVPGADVAPDRSHLEPRRSVHGVRRSSAGSATFFEHCVRRFHLRALAWLCGALALAVLLLLQAVRLKARHKPPLVTLGYGPTDEQRCCGPAPCAHEFIVPVVKASKRDPTSLESLACAWQPDAAAWQVTMVWSDEVMPRSRLSLGLKDAVYRAMRLLRYGRVRDIESFLMFPGESGGPPVHGLWFTGTFSHTSTFVKNKHFSARIPGELLTYERGRPVLYSRTWNHVYHFKPEPGAAYVSYDALPAVPASRAEVEQRFSVALPWKVAESGGARKSFAHTILFDPPELSTEEVLEGSSEDEGEAAEQQAQAELPRKAGGDDGAKRDAQPPPAKRRRRGARVRSFGARLHRWLWGLRA